MDVHTTTDEKGDILNFDNPSNNCSITKIKDEANFDESNNQHSISGIKFKIGSDNFTDSNNLNTSTVNTSGDSTPISCLKYDFGSEQNIAEQAKLRKLLSDHHQNNPDVYTDKQEDKDARESVDYKDVQFGR